MPTPDSFLGFLWNVLWRVGLAIALYFVVRRLAPWARRRLDGLLKRTKLTPAINRLALNALYYGIWAITIMTILALYPLKFCWPFLFLKNPKSRSP